MDEHPVLFLIPPVIFCTLVDWYLGVQLILIFSMLVLTFLVTHFLVLYIKGVVKKERDFYHDHKYHRYAFPSYHVGTAVALCTAQTLLLPLSLPFMIALVIMTIWGRLKLDRHDLYDAVGGVVVGIPVPILLYALF